MASKFTGGKNIALKVPPHQFHATMAFYRDVLGLPEIKSTEGVSFAFGPNRLWLDECEAVSQAELWLEIVADDTQAAAGVARCDGIEKLPPGFDAFFVSSPAAIVHLVIGSGG
jgi:catechol 2,3-dioxygenase-like lactoylglutathione lyase family enzyme